MSVKNYYNYQLQKSKHRYKGFRLWASDCSIQLLPDNESTRELGTHKYRDSEIASIKISAYFDVLSQIICRVNLFDKSKSDLFCCLEQKIEELPSDVISIYDRGYGSLLLGYLHSLHKKKYVVRVKNDFSNQVKDFISSDKEEIWITEKLCESVFKTAKLLSIDVPKDAMITYRLVKIVLSTGEIEILMTNLDDSFTISDLKHIYKLRWGIEDCFKVLKTIQMLGIFSGYSAQVVQQDIWSNLIFYNLQTTIIQEAEIKLQIINEKRAKKPSKNKKNKNNGYKINRNIATGVLQMNYRLLFECKRKELKNMIDNFIRFYLQNLELVKDKSPTREPNQMRSSDRHITEYNYKRAF